MTWARPLIAAALAVSLSSCGSDDDATDYGAEHRDAFLAACTETSADTRLVRDICECTYDRIELSIPFDEFVALETSLRLDTLTPLPESISELMAECFLDEAEL